MADPFTPHVAEPGSRVSAARDLPPSPAEQLVAAAKERMRKGLAPPAEIFQVQNRDQIDWARFPDWARPADPDDFEGCCHEG